MIQRSGCASSIVVTLALASAGVPAMADTFTCTSVCNFGPGDTLDNLNVKNGGVVTLDGTQVTGNVVGEDGGAIFLMNGVDVEGNVQSFGGSEISVTDTVVGGSIQIKNTPVILIENSTMEGDLQLEENDAASDSTSIAGNVIGGNLQLYKNDFTGLNAELAMNDVFGNLQLVNNVGGTISVIDNFVESALQCTDNESEITGSGNEVGDLECPELQNANPPAGANDDPIDVLVDDDGQLPLGLDDDFPFPDDCGAGVVGALPLMAFGALMLAGGRSSSGRRR